MKLRIAAAATLATAALVAHAWAEDSGMQSYGEAEYFNSCAACHGAEGRGDGPMAELLVKKPADLTLLQANNGGAFPYNRVYSTIDGRFQVPSHGMREMAVWGREFLEVDKETFGEKSGEIVTEERIHELTNYIQTLQR